MVLVVVGILTSKEMSVLRRMVCEWEDFSILQALHLSQSFSCCYTGSTHAACTQLSPHFNTTLKCTYQYNNINIEEPVDHTI